MPKPNDNITADCPEIDFDEWMTLYKDDPDEFERRRTAMVNAVISQAPKDHQRRLNRLQFQVDMERRRTNNPLSSCLKISSMMRDKFDTLRVAT